MRPVASLNLISVDQTYTKVANRFASVSTDLGTAWIHSPGQTDWQQNGKFIDMKCSPCRIKVQMGRLAYIVRRIAAHPMPISRADSLIY